MADTPIDTSSVQRPGAFFGHITQTVRDLAAGYLAPNETGLTLDVGCGNGLFFASLNAPKAQLVGMDLDLGLLSEAKRIFADNRVQNIRLVGGNVYALPFPDESYDNIFFLNTLVNIPTDEDARHLLGELMRVCQPGGRIFVDIRNGANPALRAKYWRHNRRADFTTRGHHLRQIGGVFAAKGFSIVRQHRIGARFPLAALAYLLEVRAPRGPGPRS